MGVKLDEKLKLEKKKKLCMIFSHLTLFFTVTLYSLHFYKCRCISIRELLKGNSGIDEG